MANLNGSGPTLIQVPGCQAPEYFGGVKRYSRSLPLTSIGDGGLFAALDFPISLVGDFVTLPLVYRMKNDPAIMKKWTGRTFDKDNPGPFSPQLPPEYLERRKEVEEKHTVDD